MRATFLCLQGDQHCPRAQKWCHFSSFFEHFRTCYNRTKTKIWEATTKDHKIDLLPNYGPGTSKRYRKPVTTGNTVISNCQRRNFRRSSDLAEAKIYLFTVLVIFDSPSTSHFSWSFCSQVGRTMVLVGVLGVFVFGRSELLYRDFDEVSDGLDLSKAGWSF